MIDPRPARFTLRALLPLLPLSTIALPAAAQPEPVAKVTTVRNDVRGTPPGGAEAALAVGSGLVLEHLVATGEDSGTRMTFRPDGQIALGSGTRLTLDQQTIDRATGAQESKLSLLVGSLRLALGDLFRGEVEVETPTSVVGVKGTDLRIFVFASGLTLVRVLEGVVEVLSKAGGEPVEVEAGEQTVIEPGAPPTAPAPAPAALRDSPAQGGEPPAGVGKPSITACPRTVAAASLVCVCGSFPTRAAAEALRIDGKPLRVTQASAGVVYAHFPTGLKPGKHTISGERSAGFARSSRCEVSAFALERIFDTKKLRPGRSSPLRIRIKGTKEPVRVRIENRSPGMVRVEGGDVQTVETSGGRKNAVRRQVRSLGAPGSFNIDYTAFADPCPCAGALADPSADPEVLEAAR